MTTNPDAVVALTAGLLSDTGGRGVSTQAGNIRSSNISSDIALGIPGRTCAVLDALAALCVSAPKSEVIAIGFSYQKPKAELIIAANNGPPTASTFNHLRFIWESLRDISVRKLPGKQSLDVDPRVDSPQFDMTLSYGDITFHKLFIQVYKHSFKLARKRHSKYWPILQKFHLKFEMVHSGQAVVEWEYEELFEKFDNLTAALSVMQRNLHALQNKAWVADTKEIDQFIQGWFYIYRLGREVLEHRLACETWALAVEASDNFHGYSTRGQLTNDVESNTPCRLRRALEKLCTFHFHLGTLLRFAFSARMRYMFSESTLTLTPVKLYSPAYKQSWPSTEKDWRMLLRDIYENQEIDVVVSTENKAKEQRMLRNALAQGRQGKHCECLLIADFLSRDSSKLLAYIGLSNLSCKACLLWMEVVGEVTKRKFFTKGSHDKWYPGWSRPASEDKTLLSQIDALFLEKVELELGENLKASRLARPRAQSDSSNSSEAGTATMDVIGAGNYLKKIRGDRGFSFKRNSIRDLASKQNE